MQRVGGTEQQIPSICSEINQIWAMLKIRNNVPFNLNRPEIHTRHTTNELMPHAQNTQKIKQHEKP